MNSNYGDYSKTPSAEDVSKYMPIGADLTEIINHLRDSRDSITLSVSSTCSLTNVLCRLVMVSFRVTMRDGETFNAELDGVNDDDDTVSFLRWDDDADEELDLCTRYVVNASDIEELMYR